MDKFIDVLWWVVALYIIPTFIVVVFCFLKGENPFTCKDFESWSNVFMPGKNFVVAGIIVFAIIPDEVVYKIKKVIKRWKRGE